jgi:5-formyltetrahydrofolate cyclo-ligase
MNHNPTLTNLFFQHVAIGYLPLPDEPDPTILPLFPTAVLPVDAQSNPVEIGRQLSERFVDASVCIYIPGRRFDIYGTRHGRGGGWYDRFLVSVPTEWLRIGVCFGHSFSEVRLAREAWDQPVDWVVVTTREGTEYYETNARTP